MTDISVKLPDGSERTLPEGSTGLDLASSIGPRLAKAALITVVDGVEHDLTKPLPDRSTVEIVTDNSDRGLHTIRHSTAHVLAQAVLELFPGSTNALGPAIENGFYYDFELPNGQTLSADDLERIEARMREIMVADQPFVRGEIGASDALELFGAYPYKCEIIERTRTAAASSSADDLDTGEVRADGAISFYRNGDSFIDMCLGPHVPSTGRLGHFHLQRVAGAYWRGDHTRPMLQRIYGTAWATAKELKEHLHRLEEAEKRDHRRLAAELDLVSWPEELGPGLAVWHPKGALIRKLMEDYSRDRHQNGGYSFVFSPHIAKSVLWETSGHLSWYKDGMYPAMELDDGIKYYPKPMNCPFHIMVYKSSQRSYRDLPLRFFELGAVYRYELSGAVHGLMRSRGFTQDDSHIFCTLEMVQDELASLLEFVLDVLRAFGFDEFQAKLSTKPEGKAVGEDSIWELATNGLREALEKAGLDYTVDHGGGAFYGPKIDVDIKDAIGRSWQLSTIQLDFNLPERFELEYTGADGSPHRPVMIHRALFGSVERFFGVLLEHYAGAFPTWLSPVQVRVLPVAATHEDYAREIVTVLAGHGLRADVVGADEQLGKRIRNAKLEKLPYVLVVGDDDVAHRSVGVNPRGGSVVRDVSLGQFVSELAAESAERRATVSAGVPATATPSPAAAAATSS
jgi:threonyl-tRNA synthetase